MPSVLRSALPSFAIVAIAIASLAGCTPDDGTTDPSATPGITTGPSGEPTTEPTDAPLGTPITATCDQLVSPETLFVYNPNFNAIEDYVPAPGSSAASAIAYQGVACRWQNATNGQNIDVSVANLDDDTLTALKNTAFADSELVPTYGDEAYFSVDESLGVAQVFQGSYWIIAESGVFFEPGDATEIVQSVIAGLGA